MGGLGRCFLRPSLSARAPRQNIYAPPLTLVEYSDGFEDFDLGPPADEYPELESDMPMGTIWEHRNAQHAPDVFKCYRSMDNNVIDVRKDRATSPMKRGRGRPKGSRKRPKGDVGFRIIVPAKHGRGRPKGSKNKPKGTVNPICRDSDSSFMIVDHSGGPEDFDRDDFGKFDVFIEA